MTSPPLPALLLASQSRDGDASQLPLADAWAIAMKWHNELKGCVRLITEHQGQVTTIVDSYAWVRFTINFPDHRSVSIARAAAVSWLYLSSCPGYEAHTNALFWRCVFSEYHMDRYRPRDSSFRSPADEPNISNAVGFFNLEGHTFPRFMVDSGDLESDASVSVGIQLFCGLSSEALDHDLDAALQQLLAQLKPIANSSVLQRRVDVCLSKLETNGFAELRNRGYAVHKSLGLAMQQLLRDINHTEDKATSLPRFRLQGFLFYDNLVIDEDSDADLLYDLMQQESFHLNYLQWINRTEVDGSAKVVASLLAQEGHAIRAKTSTIELSAAYNPAFTAFVSALPFARSAHTIYWTSRYREDEDFDEHDLPWLAYAMFHPDAAQSSWRALKTKYVEPTAKSAAVLHAMARGNNLHALLHGTEPSADAYYRGKLAADANVMAEATDGASVLVSASVLVNSWVDICGSWSPTPTAWVPVIVPGYGLGYVQAHELADVEARCASPSQLTGLTLLSNFTSLRDDAAIIIQFLAPFVSMLQYLDLREYCRWDAESLRLLVAQCPSLVTLGIGHAKDLWSQPVVVDGDALPRLKQLVLRPEFGSPDRTLSLDYLPSLGQLEALRIRIDHHPWPPRAIPDLLTNARQLRYFHWEDGLRHASSTKFPIDYSYTATRSEERLSQVQCVGDQYLYADGEMDSRAKAAVLSAVAHYQTQSCGGGLAAMGRLGSDVLVNVFQFVSTREPRVIVIEPEIAMTLHMEREWRAD